MHRDMVIYFPLGHSSDDSMSIDKTGKEVLGSEEGLRGQAVKTSPFHGGNTGSIPVGVIGFYVADL